EQRQRIVCEWVTETVNRTIRECVTVPVQKQVQVPVNNCCGTTTSACCGQVVTAGGCGACDSCVAQACCTTGRRGLLRR
ncbi:MAG: hypothetical protein N2039_15405, partial [Gemmataceae bacterium]|nr:hypothetical protein [Gemmataceae bacterium]